MKGQFQSPSLPSPSNVKAPGSIATGRRGRIGRARASGAGDREFGTQSSQTNDLSHRLIPATS